MEPEENSNSSNHTTRVILNKLKLVDPSTIANTSFSAYRQSAEVRQLWQSVKSSITTIVNISYYSAAADTQSIFDASIQIISILSASTLLSSVIHALITTQRRLKKSDEIIERIINKEIKVILYHIQVLKQNLNQESAVNKKEEKTQSPQEAILHHMDILIDSLVVYSLSSLPVVTEKFPVLHQYKVSPSTLPLRRHSQPATLARTQSSSAETNEENERLLEHIPVTNKTLSNMSNSRHSLVSSKSTSSSRSSIMVNITQEKIADTVGKKFMRSLQQTFSHNNNYMTQKRQQQQVPSRQNSVMINEVPSSIADEPKNKIQHDKLHDHHDSIINRQQQLAEQEDPDPSDNDNISLPEVRRKKKRSNGGGTLRFIMNAASRRKFDGASLSSSSKTVKSKKRLSSGNTTTHKGGIKGLFQSSPNVATTTTTKKQKQSQTSNSSGSSSSLTSLFNNNNNKEQQQQLVVVVNNNATSTTTMQGSIYSTTYSSFSSTTSSFTASTSFSCSSTAAAAAAAASAAAAAESTPMIKTSAMDSETEMITMSQRPSFLISPFTKKTDIQWTNNNEDSDDDDDDNNEQENNSYTNIDTSRIPLTIQSSLGKNNKKRRQLGSTTPMMTMTRNDLPLPPLPPATTVENFLTILNAPSPSLPPPGSPTNSSTTSSYFSARSSSSSIASSCTSTLDSMLLDDATSLTETHIEEEEEKFHPLQPVPSPTATTTAPIPPPKDTQWNKTDIMQQEKCKMNNRQEKRSNSTNSSITESVATAAATITTEMEISTREVSNHLVGYDYVNNRPPIPPRTSSMPLPPPPLTPPKNSRMIQNAPPPPVLADGPKRKTSAPQPAVIGHRRPSTAKSIVEGGGSSDSTWTHLLGNKEIRRAKLGRSLNTHSSSTITTTTSNSKKLQVATTNISGNLSHGASSSFSSGKLLKVTENGQVVMLFEMMAGKLQPISGTPEKLFERLADETAQDMDYVDIYLMNHVEFITSMELLNLLINRFHLEPSPGEYEYFVKWQFSIQTKVLHVIERWVDAYYHQDFKLDTALQKRLFLFLYHDGLLQKPPFKQQLDKIRSILKSQQQKKKHTNSNTHHLSQLLLQPSSSAASQATSNNFSFFPFVNSSNQYATTTSIIPNNHNVVYSNTKQQPSPLTITSSNHSTTLFSFTAANTLSADAALFTSPLPNTIQSFLALESKDIAKYLTLADYYLFKLILLNNVSYGFIKKRQEDEEIDYIDLMTKRANMLSHWVVHEVCSISLVKQKRALLKKFIEIAKLCLEQHNNFHTCMVLTMGLLSCHTLTSLKDTWDALSNRDTNSFFNLSKLLDVSLNMRYYRQKIHQKSSPVAIPFLPVVLKDQTFFKENSTWTVSCQDLINFTKFRSITQFVNKTRKFVEESYGFAQDLTTFYFLNGNGDEVVVLAAKGGGSLNHVGEWIEVRLNILQDCYLDSSCCCNNNVL